MLTCDKSRLFSGTCNIQDDSQEHVRARNHLFGGYSQKASRGDIGDQKCQTSAAMKAPYHGDSNVSGSLCHSQLASHNDSGKRQGSPHVDGAVVSCHGSRPVLPEQLRDEAEADGVLSGLRARKDDSGRQQLSKAIHLKGTLLFKGMTLRGNCWSNAVMQMGSRAGTLSCIAPLRIRTELEVRK